MNNVKALSAETPNENIMMMSALYSSCLTFWMAPNSKVEKRSISLIIKLGLNIYLPRHLSKERGLQGTLYSLCP